ncbi:arylesterase [Sideroxyarcus emersonii]|uniref:Arylesterase n=1 Tax=Sideroxyarcus emersonii TaxID=2764705 RepID=A0AAN1XB82_9PROT|nr:arylesterase [Sideroxyarcus emersonii]BCK88114.1 arylesterase [Sideroxyarcus emersonii]
MSTDLLSFPPDRRHRSGTGPALQLLLSIIAIVLLAACGKPKEEAIPAGSHVLALGDSLTEGAGVAPQEAWPSLLASKTGWVVINGGVSGDTSGAALQRLPALLDQHQPVLVLVTLGGNDMLRRLPQQETIANLERIVALVRAHGAKPVLLATPNPSLMGAVFQHLTAADFYQQLADAQQVPLLKDEMAGVLSDPQLKVDQLHPNAAGHVLLAEKIFKDLQSLGYIGQDRKS